VVVMVGILRHLRQVVPVGFERKHVEFAECGERLEVIRRGRCRPGRNRAPTQAQVLVVNDEVLVDMLLYAEAAAGWTRAVWIVEGEQPRLDFRDGEAGYRAGEFL